MPVVRSVDDKMVSGRGLNKKCSLCKLIMSEEPVVCQCGRCFHVACIENELTNSEVWSCKYCAKKSNVEMKPLVRSVDDKMASERGLNKKCSLCKLIMSEEPVVCQCGRCFHVACIENELTNSEVWSCKYCAKESNVEMIKPEDKKEEFMEEAGEIRNIQSEEIVVCASNKSTRNGNIIESRSKSSSSSHHEMKISQLQEEFKLKQKQLKQQQDLEYEFLLNKHKLMFSKISDNEESVSEVSSNSSRERRIMTKTWVENQNKSGDTYDCKVMKENYYQNPENVSAKLQENIKKYNDDAPWLQSKTKFLEITTNLNKNYEVELDGEFNKYMSARQILPKKLVEFTGIPEQWPLFITSYINSTRRCRFTPEENLLRLQQAIQGPARKLVEATLIVPSSIPVALNTLRMVYGRPELIMASLTKKLNTIQSVNSENLDQLVSFGIEVQNIVTSIRVCNMEKYFNHPVLLQQLLEKLPASIKLQWAESKPHDLHSDIGEFANWVMEKAERACSILPVENIINLQSSKSSKKRDNVYVTQVSTNTMQVYCPECRVKGHEIENCYKFKSYSVPKRWGILNRRRLCMRCLGPHMKKNCQAKNTCNVNGCKRDHHSLLHSELETKSIEKVDVDCKSNENENSIKASVHVHQSQQNVFMPIIPIILINKDRRVKINAFLDSGSDATIIDTDIAKQLELEGPTEILHMKWTNDIEHTEYGSKKLSVDVLCQSGQLMKLKNIRTLKNLKLPTQSFMKEDHQKMNHLKDVKLEYYQNQPPKILIGANNHDFLLPIQTIEGNPAAFKTKIGWVVFGGDTNDDECNSMMVMKQQQQHDNDLYRLVKSYFEIDSLGIKILNKHLESSADKRSNEIFQNTVKKINNRYECGLLWRENITNVPDSKGMAYSRHLHLEKKMAKDPILECQIKRKLKEYEEKGYIVKSDIPVNSSGINWYLPIFSVKNPNKPEKIRLVWDAAASIDGVSLNSLLLKGPDIKSNLIGMLLRFREKPFGISADIREMFHQIKTRIQDQSAQQFLWRDNTNKKIECYTMTVMTFGATCSPSIAQHIKNKNALEYKVDFPEAVYEIIENHYVDDWLSSFKSAEECLEIANQVKFIHSQAGFHIHQWQSNSQFVRSNLNESSSQHVKEIKEEKDQSKILGLIWNNVDDTLTFKLDKSRIPEGILNGQKTPTKREMLKTIMMLYDPLGLVANITILGKILLQEVWKTKVEWDEKLNDNHADQWNKWCKLLMQTTNIHIHRVYTNITEYYELHIFVDASEHAMAAVAYLRVENGGTSETTLIMGKTKVAPLKVQSIPRLELQAAVIGVRLANTIKKELKTEVKETIYWCDSRNVLAWINFTSRKFQSFISVRVGEILEGSDPSSWKWVPSKLNVADHGTKYNSSTMEPGGCNSWYNGPEFLRLPRSYWPSQKNVVEDELSEEIIPRSILSIQTSNVIRLDPARFSKFQRLVHATAYALRFFNRSRHEDLNLTTNEIQSAKIYIIRGEQQIHFQEEYLNLKESHPISRKSKIYKTSPFLDEDGIIRMKSRLNYIEYLSYDEKYPILLPKASRVTELIIEEKHQQFQHSNHSTVLNEILTEYRIPKARAVLKSIRKRCVRCKQMALLPTAPEMAPIPRARAAIYEPPFTYCGIDYFGPIEVISGRKTEKRWGVIFTCLTTRAVHLELACSLSTDSFLIAFRCFLARRNCPKFIYSDNGTNFKGAVKEISSLKNQITEKLRENFINIKWIFNPPAAPHMGGCYERLIRSVKTSLHYTLQNHKTNDEVLRCLLYEIENLINTRPLTYIAEDEPVSIRPNDFLKPGVNKDSPLLGSFNEKTMLLRKNYAKLEYLRDVYWKKWLTTYLPTLAPRSKWIENQPPLKIDDVVALFEEDVPGKWKLGRVISIIKSKDGNVRQIEVKTVDGIFRRPSSKIAFLESTENEESGVAKGVTYATREEIVGNKI